MSANYPLTHRCNMAKKSFSVTPFPIKRRDFLESGPVTIIITVKDADGEDIGTREIEGVDPRVFSSLSLGYNLNDKVDITIARKPVRFQISGNLIAVNSKDAK